MAGMAWFRSWHGAPTDHKWAVIAARSGAKVGVVSAVAWALFDYASQHAERGTVDGFDTETYSVYSGFSETEIEAIIKAMTDKGIIVNGRLANWEKRQPKREDDSAERVRKYRELKRTVTQGNAYSANETLREDTDKEKEERESERDDDPAAFVEAPPANPIPDRGTWEPEEPERPNLFAVYEREIGLMTPAISDELKAAEVDYPPGWPEAAMSEAARQNKRSWAYTRAILERWKIDGFQSRKKPKPNEGGFTGRRRLLEGL